MAGCSVDAVYAGIAGSHIRSLNSHGIVAIRDREVFAQDIERVIDARKSHGDTCRPKDFARAAPGIHH